VTDGEPVLAVSDLTKRFNGVSVVDGLSFQIQRGEIVSLLGPSGCGKSTTLRMIAGIEAPDGGEIRIEGEVVASPATGAFVPADRRDIGLVFQSYAIWPHMTVAQNVAYPLEVRRVSKAEIGERVARVLALVGLGGFERRPATSLSGGQQQRVALARALVYNPRLLLLDEPLSNLDARLRDELRVELRRIQRELGLTVLYVTHDQVEALSLSDRIAVMESGRIVQLGTPAAIYDAPGSLFVQNFFGRSLLIDGVLEDASGGAIVRCGDGTAIGINAAGVSNGATVRASIRVEDMHTDGPPVGATGAWEAIATSIRDIRFLGDKVECELLVGGAAVSVHLPRAAALGVGETLVLHVARACIRVWPHAST
jgi:ABC-type Fe3+/spermidine/putrescine transport system ATPase subunit